MSSAKVWAEFNAYDFESDPRWAEVKRQIENGVLEFPTGLSEKDALERMKYRVRSTIRSFAFSNIQTVLQEECRFHLRSLETHP